MVSEPLGTSTLPVMASPPKLQSLQDDIRMLGEICETKKKLKFIISNMALQNSPSSPLTTPTDSPPQATPTRGPGTQDRLETGQTLTGKFPMVSSIPQIVGSHFPFTPSLSRSVGDSLFHLLLFSQALICFETTLFFSPPLIPTPIVHTSKHASTHRPLKPKINFPEFDGTNPRSWLRKCEKFFELYNIGEQEKLSYAFVNLEERVDIWFDSYLVNHRGRLTWQRFCNELCRRFGNIRPQDIIDSFNKLIQMETVDQYQDKFEELTSYMTIINPLLNETHLVASFISGLKPELKPLVKLANLTALLDAYEIAKLYEESLHALIPFVPNPRPVAITYPRNPQPNVVRPPIVHPPNQAPLRITYPNQRPQVRAPFKPNTLPPNLEALRVQGLCYMCKEKYFPGHQC
ncbi:hypothetical protein KY284_032430 [Solanum tuberosum]|nr:hypothetical protein KY284_032430 [Solanum tuberosum]